MSKLTPDQISSSNKSNTDGKNKKNRNLKYVTVKYNYRVLGKFFLNWPSSFIIIQTKKEGL